MSVKRCLLSRVKRTVVGRAAMSVHDPKRTSSVALILPFLLAGTRVRFEGWISMLSDLLDREEFFKKQTEECRDLARNAVNGDDREFWEQAAKRWNEQLRAAKRAKRVAGNGTSEAKARQQELRRLRVAPRLRCPVHRAFSRKLRLWRACLLTHFSWAHPICRDSSA